MSAFQHEPRTVWITQYRMKGVVGWLWLNTASATKQDAIELADYYRGRGRKRNWRVVPFDRRGQ